MMKWQQLAKKVDALSSREKLILLVTVLVALLLIFMESIWAPNWQANRTFRTDLQAAESAQQSLLIQRDTLQSALQQDPNAALREENRQLSNQLEAVQDQLRASLSRLVAPEEMPGLLVALLGNNPGLQVLQVEKLPSQRLQQGEGDGAAVLYSHRVRIVVEGRFFDALKYVQKIEDETGRIRLIGLDYEVVGYPKATLTLELETLGLDERWLGV